MEKYNSIFHSSLDCSVPMLTDTDELCIQRDLVLGPPRIIDANDEHDLRDYICDWDISFEEDKHGKYIPTESSVWDFFRPTITVVYKKIYRCLKLYKGRYYQYFHEKWNSIDSLEEPSKDLFCVVFKYEVSG